MRAWFARVVLSRPWVAFLVMGFTFFLFGSCTVNLFILFHANARLLAQHGWLAVMEGGLLQLVELLVTGYFAMATYLVFKACENALVARLRAPRDGDEQPAGEE